jgi:hypothetical protein
VIDTISGETAWQQKTYDLRGKNTVEWRYIKDSSISSGSDAGWVDRVIIEELPDTSITPVLPILLNSKE